MRTQRARKQLDEHAGRQRNAMTPAHTEKERQANHLRRNRLDKYLLRYQHPQPAFYTAYWSGRQTINTAARSPKSPAI